VNRRSFATVALIAVVCGPLFATERLFGLEGISIDSLFWLRHLAFGPRHAPANSSAVVIAIDEETYRRPPFADTPQAMWTPQIAKVLDAVLDANARVIGFDVVYPTSIEPFMRGYERDFLLSLRRGAQSNRIVLGRVQHQERPISPFPGYSFVVGHNLNIRPVNLLEDEDGIIRRLPLWFMVEGAGGVAQREPSLAAELAARAMRWPVDELARRDLRFFSIPLEQAPPQEIAINFDSGPGDIPAFSLADLFACVEAGRADYFRRHFAGRVVLLGAVLDVEDRKLTSKRFITEPEGVNRPERCVHPVMPGLFRADLRRDSIPGVFIHAAAVNNLARQDYLLTPPPWAAVTIVTIAAFGVALIGMRFGLAAATAGLLLVLLVWAASAVIAFERGIVLPLFATVGACGLAFPLTLAYRFTISDRDRRQLSRAFSLYLPPTIIERLVESNRPPELGGEERELSILFSDIGKYTELAERMEPAALVSELNDYFAAMTEIVERRNGFVDKFVGDAVVAVFGAPLEDPEHAKHAVLAALEMQGALASSDGRFRFGGAQAIGIRIGINSGRALIGNIGSPRRFNYTVMGDAVNLASRIEGANKEYGTRILVSEETQVACGSEIVFRAIDRVRVVGRASPVTLFEPRGAAPHEMRETDALRAFAAAREHWVGGRFAEAERAFAALAENDGAAAAFAARARELREHPPPEWTGVTDLTRK
jgi:adenylate cyclase